MFRVPPARSKSSTLIKGTCAFLFFYGMPALFFQHTVDMCGAVYFPNLKFDPFCECPSLRQQSLKTSNKFYFLPSYSLHGCACDNDTGTSFPCVADPSFLTPGSGVRIQDLGRKTSGSGTRTNIPDPRA
jgi:hypothetical protein